ncbi:YgaP family membrane protein [Leptospira sp. GIMC2001]|uniref:YgaP family membrane protein n=1 Tax=Leptospira sp. GIMC2001 TaxID=1513297 RepID=UPI00234B15EB|nr:DUF2892 domain-containing protein [Leptospira sp. GIMC2001]WCL49496.1 DUF2892 domain-containing protein [Leptospira sp. GIMC2001]
MKLNMGTIDRIVRALLALIVAGLYFGGFISGTIAIVLGVIAIVLLGTSLVGSCPLYIPLKISTKGK